MNGLISVSDLQVSLDYGDSMPHLIAIPVKRVSTRASLISPSTASHLEQSSGKFSASSPSQHKQKRTWRVRGPSLDAREHVSGDCLAVAGSADTGGNSAMSTCKETLKEGALRRLAVLLR